MLSYRHGFHAGNHADALKHMALLECITRLVEKDKPLMYVDTHAGAGSYRLDAGFAAQNREWEGGVAKLRKLAGAPPPVEAYLRAIGDDPAAYPGSPAIAAGALRPADRLALFELHPSDAEPLAAMFARDRRVSVRNEDGLKGLRSILPPASRRGLVLVDPSYELTSDYDDVPAAIADALGRFATGVYMIWHPLLERPEARDLPGRLAALAPRFVELSLRVRSSQPGERGMAGSGVTVINPPWKFREAMAAVLPFLARALGEDAGASWSLSSRGID